MRESLVSIGRLLLFLANEAEGMRWSKDTRAQLQSMQRDIQSLSDHATYLTNKITFLLDAMLGVVSIEQNNIIKIILDCRRGADAADAGRVDLRHELHRNMPELEWEYGYPVRIDADDRSGGGCLLRVQMEEVAVSAR